MVRSVLLPHGLNHARAATLAKDNLLQHIILALPGVQDGRTEIQILFCQDGCPDPQKETAEKRETLPGATARVYWTALLRKFHPLLTVKLIDFSFTNHFHDQEKRLELLRNSDIFYCRGTGINSHEALVNISDNKDYESEVETLQYEVLWNRLIYVGICGAAKWAGDVVERPDGSVRRGLGLFGRDVFVEYADWRAKTKESKQCLEISEINYCIVDTTLPAIRSGVMMGKHANKGRKDEYRLKAYGIQQNLNGVLEYLLRKVDAWLCTETGLLFEVRIRDGMWRYRRPC